MTPTRKPIAKSVARGSRYSFAKHCFKSHTFRVIFSKLLGQSMRLEVKKLCSNKTTSILGNVSNNSLLNLRWDAVLDDVKKNAPVLHACLLECSKTCANQRSQKIAIGICASILCRNRNEKINLIQKLFSLCLYAGRASKQVRYHFNSRSYAVVSIRI